MNAPSHAADAAQSTTFDDLPLAPFLKETIRSVGYETPTPIQARAIPMVLEGRDLIALAQTGTGKTAAFVLPLLEKLSGRKERASRALILAPTRELAEQINDVIKTFAPRTGVKSVTVYGGVSHRNQITQLRARPQIIVACPGRLLDHMRGDTVDLSQIEYIVLDEADRMLDMGFMPAIKEIIRSIPEERQTLLFSATMPDEIKELSNEILKDPEVLRVRSELPVASVQHSMYTVKQDQKTDTLTSWLRTNHEALVVVFTKMKHTAKRLGDRLTKDGIPATSLHGNLSQARRQNALHGFREGSFRVLIATDIASRGIDVEGITHVLNYDMPDTLDAYIHRTGRAGRASRSGDAVSFVTREDRGMIRSIEAWLKAPITRLNAENNDESGSSDREPRERRSSASPRSHSGRGERSRSPRGDRAPRGDRGDRGDRSARPRRPRPEGSEGGERPARRSRESGEDRPWRDRPARGDREQTNQPGRTFDRDRRGPGRGPQRGTGRSFEPRAPRGGDQERSGREFQPRREGGSERPRRDRAPGSFGGGFQDRRGSRERPAREGNRPQSGGNRPFRGQQDIDHRADYVYRSEPKPHFIDRTDPEKRPQGSRFGNRPGRRDGGSSRGRPQGRGFSRGAGKPGARAPRPSRSSEE